jgi:aldehyde dehydrogenase (NAD+)
LVAKTITATAFDPAAVDTLAGHFIDGELLNEGDARIDVVRPSDGQVHGSIPAASPQIVDQAVGSAQRAQVGWAELPPRDRAGLMQRWAELAGQHIEQLAREESLVSARLFTESTTVDAPAALNWIRYYAEYADKLDGSITATRPQSLSLVTREPYGVIGAIAPWNFPLVLAVWKAAPAMAAGNSVVLKPSELTPYSITRLAALAVEAGIPPGVFNIVQGDGATTGSALVKHAGVNYVAFTGSTRTGAQIMSDAAHSGIKPVSLELGGKSPQLVFADCGNIERVAREIAWGITRNSGQLCYAGTRLVVHEQVRDDLLAAIAQQFEQLVPGPTWDSASTLAPIANAAQIKRIEGLLEQTVAEGATIETGGRAFQGDAGGWFFEPTILDGLQPGMTGFSEEFFGPILGVQTFTDPAEGIELAQHPTYGLAGSVYSQDMNRALSAARSLKAGTVWINSWGRKADMSAPFGGYRQSGFGKEGGKAGIEKFLRDKAIWIDTDIDMSAT